VCHRELPETRSRRDETETADATSFLFVIHSSDVMVSAVNSEIGEDAKEATQIF